MRRDGVRGGARRPAARRVPPGHAHGGRGDEVSQGRRAVAEHRRGRRPRRAADDAAGAHAGHREERIAQVGAPGARARAAAAGDDARVRARGGARAERYPSMLREESTPTLQTSAERFSSFAEARCPSPRRRRDPSHCVAAASPRAVAAASPRRRRDSVAGRPPERRLQAAVLCGKLPPERLLVKTAQLRRGAAGSERDAFGGSALDHLAASLAHVSSENFAPEAQTVGYVLKILAEAGRASRRPRGETAEFGEDLTEWWPCTGRRRGAARSWRCFSRETGCGSSRRPSTLPRRSTRRSENGGGRIYGRCAGRAAIELCWSLPFEIQLRRSAAAPRPA